MIKKTFQFKNGFFKNHKKIFMASCFSLMVTTPLVSCTSSSKINDTIQTYNGSYMLNNKTFDSYQNLMQYVDNNLQYVDLEGQNSTWSVSINGTTKTYSDPNELKQMLWNEYINIKTIKTDIDLDKYVTTDGVIQTSNSEVLKHTSDVSGLQTTIYLGNNDVAYSNINDAYNSYFQLQQGYYYNGIYFADLSKLRSYLQTEYFPNLNNANTIVITAPNNKSITIDLSKTDAYQNLKTFIENNAQISLSYINSENVSYSINNNNLDNQLANINLQDLNYYHVQSNQGQSRYIIDNQDNADLIGPYFYEGVLDVASFTNKSMWKKVNGVAETVYTEAKIDSMIGTFFTSIINDDNNLNKIQSENTNQNTLLFRTLLTTNDGSSYDKWFLEQLEKIDANLASEVIEANNAMMSGKKYNSFFKIPILYSFLMQRIVSYGLSQNAVYLVVDYFTNVCNFIQDVLEMVCLNSDNLLMDKNKQKKFNMVDFFNIGNPEYDINTSTQYFLNELKQQYPNLVATILIYSQAENNISLAGGLIPFESIDFNYLWEANIISIKDLYSIENELKNVYNTFSTLNSKQLVKSFIYNNQNDIIKNIANSHLESEYENALEKVLTNNCKQSVGELLTSIGSKNNQYYILSESILNTEIKIFLETGMIVKNGYLNFLQDKNQKKDKLKNFINYVKTNEQNINTYRIYLAFVLDKKMNTNYFTEDAISSSETFGFRLVSLIETVFGSFALVASTISQMYAIKNSSLPTVSDHETISLISSKEHIYETIDDNGNQWSSVLDLQDAERNNKVFFENDIFDINQDFVNPTLISNQNLPSNYKVILSDLNEVIRNSSTDYDDNLLQLIKESNELKTIDRTKNKNNSFSVILNPFDNASLQSADSFNYADETLSMVTNSIYSGSWGDDIPGFDNELIGSNPNIDGTYEAVDFKNQKKSWWSGETSIFNKVKEMGIKSLSYLLVVFEPIFTLTEIFLFVYDLLKETYTQDFYEYKTIDGTSFYWNGGMTVSKYFGFYNKQIHTIDEMELITPIAITLAQTEEFYFYNGIKYYDTTELKRKILIDYLNSNTQINNKNFTKYYSLKENSTFVAKTTNELLENIIKDLNIIKNNDGSFDYTNLNKNSVYVNSYSASYDYGYTILENDYTSLANSIINNIRPTNFVILPDIKNNVAQGNISNDFVFPGKYFDGYNIIENDSSASKVLVDNSANDLKKNTNKFELLNPNSFVNTDPIDANEISIKNLYKKFVNSFSIESKQILNTSYTTNIYSKLPNQISILNVYEIKNFKNNKTLTFKTEQQVLNYLYKNVRIVKNADILATKIYFETMWFDNKNQLIDWVHANMSKIE